MVRAPPTSGALPPDDPAAHQATPRRALPLRKPGRTSTNQPDRGRFNGRLWHTNRTPSETWCGERYDQRAELHATVPINAWVCERCAVRIGRAARATFHAWQADPRNQGKPRELPLGDTDVIEAEIVDDRTHHTHTPEEN